MNYTKPTPALGLTITSCFESAAPGTASFLAGKTVGATARAMKMILIGSLWGTLGATTARLHAASADAPSAAITDLTVASGGNSYGPLGWLDHRSSYGQGGYPEPFLVDDTDLEVNEARLDWLHTSGNGERTDITTAEVEKGFGLLTLEIEAPFETDRFISVDPETGTKTTTREQGMGNIDLGARYPIYQFVSPDNGFDLTLGAAIEVGVPTNSPVSKNTEVVPKIFADFRFGDHLTVQSIFGDSLLYGSGDEGGLHTFEYGFVFGYTITHRDLALPHVLQLIPVFELAGETELNKDDPGHNSLIGNLGFRLNLNAIGKVQPRLGFGYVFPIDKGGSEDIHRGFVTSFVFEY